MFKVLIAEDDKELRQLFAHVLIQKGFSVKGVSNGIEALEEMDKEKFDVNDLNATKILAEYAGYKGMISGQVLDLLAEKTDWSNTDLTYKANYLNNIYINKTSKLLTAPLIIASELSNGKYREILKQFGHSLGIMFQIADDILDVEGDLATIGKTPNKDSNKLTAVNIYGLEQSKKMALEHYTLCKELLSNIPNSIFLQQFTDKIFNRKK